MEGLEHLILDLALIMTVAGVVTIIFKRIKQPVVLGYIIAGFLISPYFTFLPTVAEIDSIHVWAELGIIFLMFALGLEFSFHKIAKVGGPAVITALTVVIAMIVVGYGIGIWMGWGTMNSIFLGGMLSISSTMIILKTYEERGLKEKKFAQLVLGAVIIEDIVAVFMLVVLTAISVSQNFSGFDMVANIGMMLLILVVILCVGIYLMPTLLKKTEHLLNNETLLVVSVGFCLLMVVVCVKAGFSAALGAFVAGAILGSTTLVERMEEVVEPIKDLFGAIFFVSVGMLIQPQLLIEYVGPILLLSAAVIIGMPLTALLGALVSGQTLKTSVGVGASMVQIGEFSFIIATLGISLGVMSEFLYPVVVCVSVITTFITPVSIKSSDKLYGVVTKLMPAKLLAMIEKNCCDNKNDNTTDEDWKKYLTSYSIRLVVCFAGMFTIFMLGKSTILPFMENMIAHELLCRVLVMICIIVCMVPFINIMIIRKNPLLNKLWVKDDKNKLPLVATRAIAIFGSALAITATIKAFLINIPFPIVIILALGVMIFVSQSDFVRGQSLSIEARFIANFNERILSRNAENYDDSFSMAMEKLRILEFEIHTTDTREYISDFVASKIFGISFVQLRRQNGTYINELKANIPVKEGDMLVAVGTEDRIEAYRMMLEKVDYVCNDHIEIKKLKEYIYEQIINQVAPENQIMCVEIPVTKQMKFCRKPIKDSEFRSKYKGSVIAVERNKLPIINPDISFVLNEGDIICAMGTQLMADELLKDGVIEAL